MEETNLAVTILEVRKIKKMDCSKVNDLLSAYYDDELSPEKRSAVAEHLNGCEACSSELTGFKTLSAIALRLDTPTPPEQIWNQLERQLDEEIADRNQETIESSDHRPWWSLPIPRRVALAASLLVAVGVGWFGYSVWFGRVEFTMEFDKYLDEFRRDPASAQEFLLAKYDGQVADVQRAVQRVGYQPAVAEGLPDGYAIETPYVMKMPGCTCVQCMCKRSDGSTIAIFEHDDEETKQWFGDRPEVSVTCHETPCRVVELDDGIAASWKRNDRYITVIGMRDLAELNQLVAWFDQRKNSGLPQ